MYNRYDMLSARVLFILDNENGTISVSSFIIYKYIVLIFHNVYVMPGMLYENFILRVAGSTNKQLTFGYVLKCLTSLSEDILQYETPFPDF